MRGTVLRRSSGSGGGIWAFVTDGKLDLPRPIIQVTTVKL